MSWLSFDAAVVGILATCELFARTIWPELFDEQTLLPPETIEEERDHHDEMAIW